MIRRLHVPLVFLGALALCCASSGWAAQTTQRVSRLAFDGRMVTIASPTRDAIVAASAKGVVVRVDTTRVVARPLVRLNGRTLGPQAVKRAGRLGWQISTRIGNGLRLGENALTVSARTASRSGAAVVGFRYAASTTSLLQVLSSPRPPAGMVGPPLIPLRVAAGATIVASLNGHSLASLIRVLPRSTGKTYVLHLRTGASDGLRHGPNRLVVRAYRAGRVQQVARAFTVREDVPLVGAGADQHAKRGTTVRLDGTDSRRARPGDRLRYAWRIVQRPRGSHATLEDARTAHPRLRPDLRGRYRMRLTVSETRTGANGHTNARTVAAVASPPPSAVVSASDDVTVNATEQSPLIPISTDPLLGDLTIGSTESSASGAIRGWAIDPATAEVITSAGFDDVDDVGPWITQEATISPTPLIVLTTGQNTTPNGDLQAAYKFNSVILQIGGIPVPYTVPYLLPQAFSIVGTPGSQPGSASQTCANSLAPASSCPMSGYLALGASAAGAPRYAFTWGDYVPFATKPDSTTNGLTNTMTVGSATYASATPSTGDAGGYQVVSIGRYSLSLRGNNTYWLNAGDPTVDDAQATAMAAFLTQAASDPTQLIMIASLGQPGGPSGTVGSPAGFTAVMNAVDALGGTGDVLSQAVSGTYSLVGAGGQIDGAAEASNVIVPPGGQAQPAGLLQGVLARSTSQLYQPETSTAAPVDQVLAPIQPIIFNKSAPPSSWPDSGLSDYAAASAWFGSQLWPGHGIGDPRTVYDDPTLDFDTLGTPLSQLKYPTTGAAFSLTTFNALEADYATEFPAVGLVTDDLVGLGSPGSLKAPLATTGLADYIALQAIAASIEGSLSPPPTAPVTFDFADFVDNTLTIAAALTPELEAPLEIMGAVAGMAGDVTLTDAGDPSDEVVTTAAQLSTAIANHQAAMLDSFDTIAEIAVDDHDKLIATAKALQSSGWTDITPGEIAGSLETSASQSFVEALMPLLWTYDGKGKGPTRAYYDQPSSETDMATRECSLAGTRHPFDEIDPTFEHAFQSGWTSATQVQYTVWWWLAASGPGTARTTDAEYCKGWDADDYPPLSLTQPMFAPPGATVTGSSLVGIGLYAPWFWQRYIRGACFRASGSDCNPMPGHQGPAPAWSG